MRQHHVIARERGIKKAAEDTLTQEHHVKIERVNGQSRTYSVAVEGTEQYPPANERVQVRVEDILVNVADALVPYYDVTLTKDTGNTIAKADLIVEGRTMAVNVPVVTLLWLEDRLAELKTFIDKLPTLDEKEEWHWDAQTSTWATTPTKTAKTAKVPTPLEKAPATDKHPAQVEIIHVDRIVGHWTTIRRSGALESDRVRELQRRVRVLLEAVKQARTTANETEVTEQRVGRQIFDYLFTK
jgi:hypothetical protein